jgi:hypothetical protein
MYAAPLAAGATSVVLHQVARWDNVGSHEPCPGSSLETDSSVWSVLHFDLSFKVCGNKIRLLCSLWLFLHMTSGFPVPFVESTVPALGRQKQEDSERKASLGYTVSSRLD